MASNSKKRRRVLGASCILAALIIASSSFAWFTSKDEVTNRLTATADYGVSIVEDFTPPKSMTPGQTVNKDVSAVNTGSVDAFVRMALKDYITMSRLSSVADTVTVEGPKDTVAEGSFSRFVKADGTIVDKKIKELTDPAAGTVTSADKADDETFLYNLRLFKNSIAAYTASGDETEGRVELNPQEKVSADGTKEANEVTTLMAGGRLMVAGNRAVEPEKQIVRSGDDVNGANDTNGFAIIYESTASGEDDLYVKVGSGYKKVKLNQDGLYVIDTDATPTASALKVKYLARDYSGAGQYQVQNEGIYLFQRTGTNVTSSNSAGNPTYSGFYYESGKFYAFKTQKPATTAPTTLGTTSTAVIDFGTGTGTGVTLENVMDGSDVVGQVVQSIGGLELLTKIDNIKNSASNTWTFEFYDKMEKANSADSDPVKQTTDVNINSNAKYIKAIFSYGASDTKPVVFWIKLDDDWAKTWTYVGENGSVPTDGDSAVTGDKGNVGYFYYRTLLNSGDTSTKLVDSVTLDKNMTSANYLDLVYDLNVTLDSVQVTMDEYNNETDAAVPTTWAKSAHAIKKNAATTTTAPATTIAPASDVIKGDSDSGTIDWINWGDSTSTD